MITEYDLQEAIAECEGQRNPNANTCIKLAAFYTIRDHLYPREESFDGGSGYSYDSGPDTSLIDFNSGSRFSECIDGRDIDSVLKVMDELMTTLSVINPRLYNSVIDSLTHPH